jgi:hypothetical protein
MLHPSCPEDDVSRQHPKQRMGLWVSSFSPLEGQQWWQVAQMMRRE